MDAWRYMERDAGRHCGDKRQCVEVSGNGKRRVSGNGNDSKGTIDVLLDGKPISETGHAGDDVQDSKLHVHMAQLYKLVHFDRYNADTTIELHVSAGVQLNTFTFGG